MTSVDAPIIGSSNDQPEPSMPMTVNDPSTLGIAGRPVVNLR
jgi:hypothetical protein